MDDDKEGEPFAWVSVTEAIRLFREKVSAHFGELIAVPSDGGKVP